MPLDEVTNAPIVETASAAPAPSTTEISNSAAPAVEAASAAPVVTTTPAQEVVKTAESAPVITPTPGAEEKPAEAAKPSTILGAEPPKAEEKPVAEAAKPSGEKKPAEAAKPGEQKAEGSQSAEPAPLPTYDEFKLPEGISLKPELVGDFTKLLGAFENGPKDHASTQALGQQLVDKHVSLVKEGVDKIHEAYAATWEKQKTDWLQEFKDDPEIGGNRQDTTVTAAHKFINTHGGTPEEQTEFRQLMEKTGLGNNKVMIRMLAKASKNMAEGRMNPGTKPIKETKSKTQTLYGKSA